MSNGHGADIDPHTHHDSWNRDTRRDADKHTDAQYHCDVHTFLRRLFNSHLNHRRTYTHANAYTDTYVDPISLSDIFANIDANALGDGNFLLGYLIETGRRSVSEEHKRRDEAHSVA